MSGRKLLEPTTYVLRTETFHTMAEKKISDERINRQKTLLRVNTANNQKKSIKSRATDCLMTLGPSELFQNITVAGGLVIN